MSKIVLIDPRGWQGAVSGYRPSPNIGLAYLVPMLHKYQHEVLIIDLNNEAISTDEVLARIHQFAPDVVGFSVKTATMKNARVLAKTIKDLLPQVPVVLGGPHTKLAWHELALEPWFDVIFVGEGEHVFPTICQRLVLGERVEDLPGVITRCSVSDDFRLNRPLVASADLTVLPYAEYDLFPENVRKSLPTFYPLVTSRGCVFDCTFCSVPEISGKGFRKRSPKSIVDELRWAREKYAASAFWIVDDVFNLDIKRCKEICRALIPAGLGMTWSCPNGLRADRVDRELAELMYAAGCRSVNVGIESVIPHILATVKKGETITDIERGIRIFQEAGMKVTGFFIIGLPGDTLEAEKCAVDFVKRAGINAHFNLLVPYPGTEIWKWAKANARFLEDPEDGIHFRTEPERIKIVIETDEFTAVERRRAYEMVHTKLRKFDMLIPPNIPPSQYHRRMLRLLWNHDRNCIPNYITSLLFRRLAPRGFSRKLRKQIRLITKATS